MPPAAEAPKPERKQRAPTIGGEDSPSDVAYSHACQVLSALGLVHEDVELHDGIVAMRVRLADGRVTFGVLPDGRIRRGEMKITIVEDAIPSSAAK